MKNAIRAIWEAILDAVAIAVMVPVLIWNFRTIARWSDEMLAEEAGR